MAESDESKKDIAATYAYGTFWTAMRTPIFIRAPFVALAAVCATIKMVEHTVDHVKAQRARPDMSTAVDEGDVFAGAFGDG